MGVGFPYAITVALFGGTAEYVALYLKEIGYEHAFFWYVTACIFISLVVYGCMRDTRSQSAMDRHVCGQPTPEVPRPLLTMGSRCAAPAARLALLVSSPQLLDIGSRLKSGGPSR